MGPGADGTKLLVALEDSEGGVSHLDTVELSVRLTHPAEQSGPPGLSAGSNAHGHTTDYHLKPNTSVRSGRSTVRGLLSWFSDRYEARPSRLPSLVIRQHFEWVVADVKAVSVLVCDCE